ncbi:MAG: TetR/AcrR family transcriptional regulator [Thermoplasmata archaeon]|nr:TetR/AcrR family transcriptional regulator [Thermoplasmata archaeon]
MPKVVPGYKEQAQLRITDAARVVFQRKGFTRTTMDDIAKEVGVSKGAIYLYFRTKAELLIHVNDRARNEVLAGWEQLLEEGDVAEGIARSLDPITAGNVDLAVWFRLVAEAANDADVRAALEADHRDDSKEMRRFLRRLEARGRIPKMHDPAVIAEAVLMLLAGAASRALVRQEGDVRDRLEKALRVVLRL